jgi:hypothetical protein
MPSSVDPYLRASPCAPNPLRSPRPFPAARAQPTLSAILWTLSAVAIATACYIIIRSCGYDVSIPAKYSSYFLLQIALPGYVVLSLARVRPLSPSTIIALGLPTGFAIEIFSFLACSAIDARGVLPWLPAVWLMIALLLRRQGRPFQINLSGLADAATVFALSALFLGMVIAAASQMYAESPLINGLPQRPIFHDWVYLLSRAAVIKHHWPIEDPSLAGTSLQYHYFLLVHVAAASRATDIDVTWLLLRLVVVPLGLIFTVQAYAVGKLLSRSRWGGVLAAVLAIVPGELSSATDYDHLAFLGLFVRWLYVSPTFFFGVIFFGALLLAIAQPIRRVPQVLWIGLLVAAATAAKGSVLPVLLGGLGLWLPWIWFHERRFPLRLCLMAAGIIAVFTTVYLATMAAWGAAGAVVQPFEVCRISEFWDQHAVPWTRLLKHTLHAPDFGTWLGGALTSLGVLAGTTGVRLVGAAYLVGRRNGQRLEFARWLAATAVASYAIGLTLHFDANSELYFLLLSRLPTAALAAAFVIDLARRWQAYRRIIGSGAAGWCSRLAVGSAALVIAPCLALQVVNTVTCHRGGLIDWIHFDPKTKINADLLPLYEVTTWLRDHTEPEAVLLTNAFTVKNLNADRGILVDHTTVGVHYYFSALTERRLWIEGPTYALDQTEARRRLIRSAQTFYAQRAPPQSLLRSGPSYIVLDHAVGDGATFSASYGRRVFANERFEVFHLNSRPASAALVSTN